MQTMFSQFKWDKAKPIFDAGSSKKSKGSDQKAILCSPQHLDT